MMDRLDVICQILQLETNEIRFRHFLATEDDYQSLLKKVGTEEKGYKLLTVRLASTHHKL